MLVSFPATPLVISVRKKRGREKEKYESSTYLLRCGVTQVDYELGVPPVCFTNGQLRSEEDVCKLYCITEDFDFFFAMSSKVQDGTSCSENQRDVCIDGACEAVGCDQMLGSKASLDACGVCKGDNNTCRFFSGRYTLQHRANGRPFVTPVPLSNGNPPVLPSLVRWIREYYSVVTVPAGARSVLVQEVEASSSYLAVRSLKMEHYLTGDWIVDWPGKFFFGGTVFDYQRPFDRPERLYAAGPTNETLVFEILLQGQNPGVMWEYTLPRERKPDFTWGVARSDCSAACAGGRISTKAICLQDQKVQVNSSLCDPRTWRTVGSLLCNTQPCPAYSAVVQPTESGPEIEPPARLIRECNDHLEHEWDQPSEREELIT
ncbi:unnamed protein product [Arctogadus glacialis]